MLKNDRFLVLENDRFLVLENDRFLVLENDRRPEWTWIVSIYNIFRTGRTEPVKNEWGLEEEPARNRFHRWASGRAISVEISCLTVLATALWAPSILCVARGALQLFLLGCCLSWLSLGILVNFLGLCF